MGILAIVAAPAGSAAAAAGAGGRMDWLIAGLRDSSLNVLLAFAILLTGWLVAHGVSVLVQTGLGALRFNHALRQLLRGRAMVGNGEAAATAAWLAFWGVLALTWLVALDLVGIHARAAVSGRLADLLPRAVVAALVSLVGMFAAVVAGAMTRSALRGFGWRRPALAGRVAFAVVLSVALLLAVEQLGVAAQLVVGAGLILVAGAALAVALAFGLGCRDMARDVLIEFLRLREEGPAMPRERTGTEDR
ncbi:MAG: hypothetical protein HZB25_09695 [Candidatus Eisenbacteria bacterium]|nr:hypothetical protein [Candidatus Eisenbacteria bacterium]